MHTPNPDLPVAVAVSGGTDSLYALLRLREQGRRVFALHGIFARNAHGDAVLREMEQGVAEGLGNICAGLGIPLHLVDLSEGFLEAVVRPFAESYAAGLTPNPCALCNARIKFGLLLDAALSLGAGSLATGHYVRAVSGGEDEGESAAPRILQSADRGKDQSYFLSLVPPQRLARALFPLGSTLKADAREYLARHGVQPPQKGESTEVCFIPNDDYRAFLPFIARRLNLVLSGPGPMLLEDGTRVGTHKGLWAYTEGQRKGLGVGWKEPLHVLAKERKGNVLRLGPRSSVHSAGCLCGGVNFLIPPAEWPETVMVKTRYREIPRPARAEFGVSEAGPVLRIRFEQTDDSSAAPGQVAAVYIPSPYREEDGTPILRLAGGGIIAEGDVGGAAPKSPAGE